MSQFEVETPEERRNRYLRLARAAASAAEKTPTPGAKDMYFKLARSWAAMPEEHETADGAAPYTPARKSISQVPA